MNYPKQLLLPILEYFKKAEQQLISRKTKLATEDPFADPSRLDDNADMATEASEQFGHEQSAVMGAETDLALSRVRAAMKRIDDGTYGKCVSCGVLIDTDRLGIDPTAELCVACAKKNVK
ncbi:MAG: RNA polymerase-binding protein DksA [Candidatus Microgenomates bacterium]